MCKHTLKPVNMIGKKLVQDIFSKQKILTLLGTKLVDIHHGRVELSMPKTQNALQQHGFFHGGIITSLADTAAGLAGCSVLTNQHHSTITVELKINFLRPADGDSLYSIGHLLKQNKSLMVTTAQVFSNDKLCAYMLQTIMRVVPHQKPHMKVLK